jgi:hypothetical protein
MGAGVTYEGWKNRSTWNVSLWINNDEPLYRGAVEFMKDYKGKRPYIDFCRDSGLEHQRTPDKIEWVSGLLDYKALNEMMWELAPEGARHVQ